MVRDALTVAGCHRLLVMVELSRAAIQGESASPPRCYARPIPSGRKAESSAVISAGPQEGEARLAPVVVGELAEQKQAAGTEEEQQPGAEESPPRVRLEERGAPCSKRELLYAQLTLAISERGASTSQKPTGKSLGMTGLRTAPRIFTEELKAFCFDRFLNEYSPRRRRRGPRTHTFRSQCTSPGRKHIASPINSPKAGKKK